MLDPENFVCPCGHKQRLSLWKRLQLQLGAVYVEITCSQCGKMFLLSDDTE